MKISGCIIARDESSNIEKCIKSLKDIVDEIILVDTGSKDNTVNISKQLGAKVLFYSWENNFCFSKKFCH